MVKTRSSSSRSCKSSKTRPNPHKHVCSCAYRSFPLSLQFEWAVRWRVSGSDKGHGIPVWYSQTNILGTQQWQDEIGAAIERCDWFTVILSPQSVKSMWVKRELSKALSMDRFENKIVPIIYERADYEQLHWTLCLFQMIDFSSSVEAGYEDLFRIWGLGYRGRNPG
jgi:hypothetical protein